MNLNQEEQKIHQQKRFQNEIDLFYKKWGDYKKKGDPYYNVNLRLDSDQYDIKQEKIKYK